MLYADIVIPIGNLYFHVTYQLNTIKYWSSYSDMFLHNPIFRDYTPWL